jgi:hypothetical protein
MSLSAEFMFVAETLTTYDLIADRRYAMIAKTYFQREPEAPLRNRAAENASGGGSRMRITILITVFLLLGAAAAADTIVVSPTGPMTIQEAVDHTVNGDIIELLDGIYTGDGNRDLHFVGRAITLRSQSGDPTACIIDCQASDTDPHLAFLLDGAEGPDTVIEGLTITGGYHTYSGGIYCPSGEPTIRNCHLVGNHGTEGAGVCVYGPAEIVGCWFEDNVAAYDGGGASACCNFGPVATFRECTFVGNTAGQRGGAFRC